MQTLKVQIDIESKDISSLICSDPSDATLENRYTLAVATSLANSLHLKDFLFRPERINELRRTLWERDQITPVPFDSVEMAVAS